METAADAAIPPRRVRSRRRGWPIMTAAAIAVGVLLWNIVHVYAIITFQPGLGHEDGRMRSDLQRVVAQAGLKANPDAFQPPKRQQCPYFQEGSFHPEADLVLRLPSQDAANQAAAKIMGAAAASGFSQSPYSGGAYIAHGSAGAQRSLTTNTGRVLTGPQEGQYDGTLTVRLADDAECSFP